jgi:hypothetical protein
MDFFTELLESFSRKHDRKLRLLEQDKDSAAEQLAKSAMATGQQQSASQAFDNPISRPNGKPIYVWTTGKGALVFSYQRSTVGTKNIEQNYEEFVNAFSEDAPDQEALDTEEAEKRKAEAEAAKPVVASNIDEALLKMGIDLKADPAMAEMFRGLYDQALLFAPGAGESGTAAGLASAKRAQAIAFVGSIIKDFPIVAPEGDLFRIVPSQSSRDRTLALAEVLANSDSDSFCGKLRRTDKDQLIVDTNFGGKSQGTVFSSGQKEIIEGMLGKAKCGDIPTVNIIEDTGGDISSENNTRGTALEKPATLLALGRRLRSLQGIEGEERDNVIKEMKRLEGEIRANILSLNEAKEVWLQTAKNTAIPQESQAEFDYLESVLGNQGKLLQAMFIIAKASSNERNADFVVHAGAVVGQGRKQDSVEMWTDKKKAREAMKSSLGKAAGNKVSLRKVRAEDVYRAAGKSDEFDFLVKNKMIEENQEVYVSEVSYKNVFRSGKSATGSTSLGTGTDTGMDLFMTGRGPNSELFDTFTEAAGMSDQDRTEFDAIAEEQAALREDIDSLSNNITTIVDGKEVTTETLNKTIDSALESMQRNFTFSEQENSKFRSKIMDLAEEYKNATPDKKPNLEKQMRAALKGPILMSHLNKKQDTKGGQFYALAMMYRAGGSKNAGTLLQVNNLNTGITHISTQNHQFEEIAKSIREGNEDFNLNITNSAFSFRKADDRNASVRLEWSGDNNNWLCTESETMTSKHSQTQRRFLTENERQDASLVWDALSKLHEALGIIKEKVRILDAN